MPRSPGHALYSQGTPTEAAEAANAIVFVIRTDATLAFGLIAAADGELAALVVSAADPNSD